MGAADKKCSSCNVAHYCSEECIKNDWEVHKWEEKYGLLHCDDGDAAFDVGAKLDLSSTLDDSKLNPISFNDMGPAGKNIPLMTPKYVSTTGLSLPRQEKENLTGTAAEAAVNTAPTVESKMSLKKSLKALAKKMSSKKGTNIRQAIQMVSQRQRAVYDFYLKENKNQDESERIEGGYLDALMRWSVGTSERLKIGMEAKSRRETKNGPDVDDYTKSCVSEFDDFMEDLKTKSKHLVRQKQEIFRNMMKDVNEWINTYAFARDSKSPEELDESAIELRKQLTMLLRLKTMLAAFSAEGVLTDNRDLITLVSRLDTEASEKYYYRLTTWIFGSDRKKLSAIVPNRHVLKKQMLMQALEAKNMENTSRQNVSELLKEISEEAAGWMATFLVEDQYKVETERYYSGIAKELYGSPPNNDKSPPDVEEMGKRKKIAAFIKYNFDKTVLQDHIQSLFGDLERDLIRSINDEGLEYGSDTSFIEAKVLELQKKLTSRTLDTFAAQLEDRHEKDKLQAKMETVKWLEIAKKALKEKEAISQPLEADKRKIKRLKRNIIDLQFKLKYRLKEIEGEVQKTKKTFELLHEAIANGGKIPEMNVMGDLLKKMKTYKTDLFEARGYAAYTPQSNNDTKEAEEEGEEEEEEEELDSFNIAGGVGEGKGKGKEEDNGKDKEQQTDDSELTEEQKIRKYAAARGNRAKVQKKSVVVVQDITETTTNMMETSTTTTDEKIRTTVSNNDDDDNNDVIDTSDFSWLTFLGVLFFKEVPQIWGIILGIFTIIFMYRDDSNSSSSSNLPAVYDAVRAGVNSTTTSLDAFLPTAVENANSTNVIPTEVTEGFGRLNYISQRAAAGFVKSNSADFNNVVTTVAVDPIIKNATQFKEDVNKFGFIDGSILPCSKAFLSPAYNSSLNSMAEHFSPEIFNHDLLHLRLDYPGSTIDKIDSADFLKAAGLLNTAQITYIFKAMKYARHESGTPSNINPIYDAFKQAVENVSETFENTDDKNSILGLKKCGDYLALMKPTTSQLEGSDMETVKQGTISGDIYKWKKIFYTAIVASNFKKIKEFRDRIATKEGLYAYMTRHKDTFAHEIQEAMEAHDNIQVSFDVYDVNDFKHGVGQISPTPYWFSKYIPSLPSLSFLSGGESAGKNEVSNTGIIDKSKQWIDISVITEWDTMKAELANLELTRQDNDAFETLSSEILKIGRGKHVLKEVLGIVDNVAKSNKSYLENRMVKVTALASTGAYDAGGRLSSYVGSLQEASRLPSLKTVFPTQENAADLPSSSPLTTPIKKELAVYEGEQIAQTRAITKYLMPLFTILQIGFTAYTAVSLFNQWDTSYYAQFCFGASVLSIAAKTLEATATYKVDKTEELILAAYVKRVKTDRSFYHNADVDKESEKKWRSDWNEVESFILSETAKKLVCWIVRKQSFMQHGIAEFYLPEKNDAWGGNPGKMKKFFLGLVEKPGLLISATSESDLNNADKREFNDTKRLFNPTELLNYARVCIEQSGAIRWADAFAAIFLNGKPSWKWTHDQESYGYVITGNIYDFDYMKTSVENYLNCLDESGRIIRPKIKKDFDNDGIHFNENIVRRDTSMVKQWSVILSELTLNVTGLAVDFVSILRGLSQVAWKTSYYSGGFGLAGSWLNSEFMRGDLAEMLFMTKSLWETDMPAVAQPIAAVAFPILTLGLAGLLYNYVFSKPAKISDTDKDTSLVLRALGSNTSWLLRSRCTLSAASVALNLSKLTVGILEGVLKLTDMLLDKFVTEGPRETGIRLGNSYLNYTHSASDPTRKPLFFTNYIGETGTGWNASDIRSESTPFAVFSPGNTIDFESDFLLVDEDLKIGGEQLTKLLSMIMEGNQKQEYTPVMHELLLNLDKMIEDASVPDYRSTAEKFFSIWMKAAESIPSESQKDYVDTMVYLIGEVKKSHSQ